MDKETFNLIISILGGHVTHMHGHITVRGLTKQAADILDALNFDIEQVELNEEIERVKADPMVGSIKLRRLLMDCDYWQCADCPTLDIARLIRDEFLAWPGAILLQGLSPSDSKAGWELWLKIGPEYPVYPSLKAQQNSRAQSPAATPGRPLHAILVKSAGEMVSWDFGWFDGVNWNSFQNGLITGLTRKVVRTVELPDTEEI